MSSTLVVAATGPTGSTPQGARHPCLQLWWWPLPDLPTAPRRGPRHLRLQLWWWSLPDLPAAPPRGLAIDVSNFGGGRCQIYRQHPLGGPPSMSPTSVVAAARPTGSTPKGPAIYVSNFSGGHCQTYRQHPQGPPPSTSSTLVVATVGPAASTPRGALSTSPTSGPLALAPPGGSPSMRFLALMVGAPRPPAPAPPGGPPSTVVNVFLSVDGGRSWTCSSGTSRGPTVDCRVKSTR
jgi:hypothetical protein